MSSSFDAGASAGDGGRQAPEEPASPAFHTFDKAEFRRVGHEIIDWLSEYLEKGHESGPVYPRVAPGDVARKLPLEPPEEAESLDDCVRDFHELILPALTHWNDRRFLAYFPSNNSPPSVLAELLTAGLGVNAFSWTTSPAATELEGRVLDWLARLLGLPMKGAIQESASAGVLCALLAARERVTSVNRTGFQGSENLVAYASEHAHSSVMKAVRIAGIGDENLRLIPVDENHALSADVLAEVLAADERQGKRPFFLVSTIGTTSLGSVDPTRELARLAKSHGLWLHVDAAYGGALALLPEKRPLFEGVEDADSFLFNPHKWLFTNFDCTAFFCREPNALKRALAISPEYLKTAVDGEVENYRDWSLQLGRRFRALKLWFVIRAYGVSGLRERLRLHVAMASWFARQVEREPRLRLVATPEFGLVCFRALDNETSEKLLQALNASGQMYLSPTVVDQSFILRVSFGQTNHTMEDAEKAWGLVRETLDRL